MHAPDSLKFVYLHLVDGQLVSKEEAIRVKAENVKQSKKIVTFSLDNTTYDWVDCALHDHGVIGITNLYL